MKVLIGMLLALVTTLIAVPAWAMSLDAAKSQGLVGEMASGYLGAVAPSASADVAALISDINAKRRAKYAEIAAKNGTSLAAVEALAGKKAVEETAPGNFVQTSSGAWRRK